MTTSATREEFLAALRLLEEGRSVHSTAELTLAKEVLKPIVRYQWPQIALVSICFVAAAILAINLFPAWPRYAPVFAAGLVGPLTAAFIMRIPSARPLFVPAGFEVQDVTRASRYVFA